MKRFIVLLALAALLLPQAAFGWGSAHPDNSDDYHNRTYATFRGHELLLHDALLMLKSRRLIPASLGEHYLQPIYCGPNHYPTLQTSWGYKYLIKGVRLADYDWTLPYTGWSVPWVPSSEHYYDPLMPFLSDPIIGFMTGGFNAKTAFMVYINGGTITSGLPGTQEEPGAIQRFKNGDLIGGFQALGYAIHYLQDMSMPYHATPYHALTTVHGPVDGRGDTLIYNERLQFEKDALERCLPYNDLSFANDAITNKSMRGSINSIMRSLNYNHSQNLDDFIHAAAKEAANTIQYIDPYWFPPGFGPTNWTQIESQIRPLMKRNEERIAQLIFYVFWKANMYPASLTSNSGYVQPNTPFFNFYQPTSHRKVECTMGTMGPGGFGTIMLNRSWVNDNLTIKSGASGSYRATITLVGRDGRVIAENTGPAGGEAVINTSCGSNTGWYTLYATSKDITSGTGNVYVNIWNNAAKEAVNEDKVGKAPPQVKVMQTKGGGKTGAPQAGAAKGESPFVEIGYDLGRLWDAAGNGYRYKINDYHYDTDLFWTDMSYNYGSTWHGGNNNAVLAYIVVRFINFYYDHSVRTKLYRPDGVLYGQSGLDWVYGMNTSGFTWNWWDVSYCWYLKWDGYDYWMQNYQGIWRYEVYIDNNLYTTQYFGVNAPPTITNIASGAYINGGPVEIGTSVKGVPNYVDIRLDGTSESNRVSLDYAAPYSGVANASILADGAHTVYAYVKSGTPHTNGNRWSSALSFTVDKTKPTVAMTSPANGSTYTAGSAVTVSANASDARGVSKVVFYANGKEIASDNASPYSCNWTVPATAQLCTLMAVANDLAGNSQKSAEITIMVVVFSDNFDDGSISDWTITGYGITSAVSTAYSVSPSYSLRQNAYYSMYSGSAYRSFPAQTATFTAEWDMLANTGNNGLAINNGTTYTNYDGVCVYFGGVGANLYYYSDAGSTLLCASTQGRWYHIKAVVNPPAQNVQIYVDGSLKYNGNMCGYVTSFSKVHAAIFGFCDSYFDNITITTGAKGVAVSEQTALPSALPAVTLLSSWAPNPTTGQTTISFQLAAPAQITIKVYNIQCQLVKTLASETKSAGYHSVRWDGKDEHGSKVAAGVYLYRMQAGDYSKTNKMTILR